MFIVQYRYIFLALKPKESESNLKIFRTRKIYLTLYSIPNNCYILLQTHSVKAHQIRSRISPYRDSSLPNMVKSIPYTEIYETVFSSFSRCVIFQWKRFNTLFNQMLNVKNQQLSIQIKCSSYIKAYYFPAGKNAKSPQWRSVVLLNI